MRVERTGRIVRVVGLWNCILSADIDATTADRVISAQQDHFRKLGSHVEWKVYGHDEPRDLPRRLENAGFQPEAAETLMAFDLREHLPGPELPPDLSVRRIVDAGGLENVAAVGKLAFGVDFSPMNAEFAARLPLGTVSFYVAFSASEPVGAARLELPPQNAFAGLYGGGTVPEHRRRGIYRSLVAARAEEARNRGYRYLNVEAESSSRPILERLGFVPLSSVRAWVWRPN